MNILDINMNVVYTIVNLLLLVVLFRIFLFKRVDKILNIRQHEADTAKEKMDGELHDAEELKHDYQVKLKEQEDAIDHILAEARERGYQQYNEIVENANKEAAAILEEARMHAKADAERERARYMANLTDVVIDAAAKIAANSHTEASDKDLYDSFIDEALNSHKES